MRREREKQEIEAAPRQRKPPAPENVAARVKKFLKADAAPMSTGVQPLNAGFFALQRMRNPQGAKKCDKVRQKIREE